MSSRRKLKESLESKCSVTSPLMFESDEDESESATEDIQEKNDSFESESRMNSESAVTVKERKILKGLQTVLTGIPPPPAFTVPQLDCREILKLWRENQKFNCFPENTQEKKENAESVEDEAKDTGWPSVLEVNHWDVYYNRSGASEEIERLGIKYKERYVGAETSSCINALYVKSPVRTASARKRQRNRAWGHSPGRRLSHIARRRKVFSSASLATCSVAGNNNPDKKMIMVEIKKTANRQKKRNSVKKTKPTPKKKNEEQANSFKRALFQSPDQQSQMANSTRTPSTQCVQRSKRNLFAEEVQEKVNENGKRERVPERRMSPRKRVNRSLSFQESVGMNQSVSNISMCSTSGLSQPSTTQNSLSEAHKKKMMWAVSDTLKEVGVTRKNEMFNHYLNVLFKSCQKLWKEKVAKDERHEGSTSENMRVLVRQYRDTAIEEINKVSKELKRASVGPETNKMYQVICTKIFKSAANITSQQNNAEVVNRKLRSGNVLTTETSVEAVKTVPEKTPVKLFTDKVNTPRRSSPRRKVLFDDNLSAGPSCSVKRTPVKHSSPQIKPSPKTGKSTPKRKYGDLRVMLSAMKEKAESARKKEISDCESTVEDINQQGNVERVLVPESIGFSVNERLQTEKVIRLFESKDEVANCVERKVESDEKTTPSKKTKNCKERKSPSVKKSRCSKKDKSSQSHESKDSSLESPEISYRVTRRRSQEQKDDSNSSKENVDSLQNEVEKDDKRFSKRTTRVQNISPFKSPNSLPFSPNILTRNNVKNLTAASTLFSPERDEFEIHSSPLKTINIPHKLDNSEVIVNVSKTLKNEIVLNSPVVLLKSILCKSSPRTSTETRSPAKSVSIENNSNSMCSEESKTEISMPLRRRSLRSTSRESPLTFSSVGETTIKSPDFVNCHNLSQKSDRSESRISENDKENKENLVNRLLTDGFATAKNSWDKHLSDSSLTDDTPKSKIIPTEAPNRTWQLYRLSNSGGEQVETDNLQPIVLHEEPPKLLPHWEQDESSECSSVLPESPPSLMPHWETASVSEASTTGTPLPENIMTHWQQMTSHKTNNTSDKIMFDFEDTSYEINFPSADDDSNSSSICGPIDLPPFCDDSKSGFPVDFRCGKS